jgi:hypothetical protein
MPINPYEPPRGEGEPQTHGWVKSFVQTAQGWLAGGIVGFILSWLFLNPLCHHFPSIQVGLCFTAICAVVGGALNRESVPRQLPSPQKDSDR